MAFILLHRIEVVQAHTIGGTQGALLRLIKFLRVRIVLDMMGAYPEETEYAGASGETIRRLNALERKVLEDCNWVYCVSNNMVVHLQRKHHLRSPRFEIVPCCVPSTVVGAAPERRQQVRRSLGLEGRFVLVYSGGTAPYQCIPAMCELFSAIAQRWADVVWLVLSWGDLAMFRMCLEKIGVDSRRYCLKRLEQSEVHDHLLAGDAALLLREDHLLNRVSSPTKFAEYLAAGLPVITTPYVGDVAGIVTREDIGIVIDSPPATELETLMSFIAEVRDHRKEYARRCLEYVKREWTWESHKQQFLDAIGVECGGPA